MFLMTGRCVQTTSQDSSNLYYPLNSKIEGGMILILLLRLNLSWSCLAALPRLQYQEVNLSRMQMIYNVEYLNLRSA